jgi:hypothetical protein
MNKFRNKWIFIITILVIILGIVIYSNKDNISEMIGINARSVAEDNKVYSLTDSTCKKKVENNQYILGAYEYNDTVSSGETGYCVAGTEDTCIKSNCIYDASIGACSAGTIIKYQVNNNDIYYFNVLHDDAGVMTLQSVDAIAQSAWDTSSSEGPVTALTAITEATKDWSNVNDLTYTLGETIFLKYPNDSNNANPYTNCPSYNSCTSNSYTLSSSLTTNVKARIISMQEASDLGCTDEVSSCPSFMFYNKTEYWALNTYDNYRTIWSLNNRGINYDAAIWYVNTHTSYVCAVVEINKW